MILAATRTKIRLRRKCTRCALQYIGEGNLDREHERCGGCFLPLKAHGVRSEGEEGSEGDACNLVTRPILLAENIVSDTVWTFKNV